MSSEQFDPAAPSQPPATALAAKGRGGLVAVAALVVLGGAAAWFFATQSGKTPDLSSGPLSVSKAPPPVAEVARSPAEPSEPAPSAALPSLDGSDDLFRTWARQVMGGQNVDAWLSTSGLVRRLVAAVSSASEGESPAMLLPFLAPEGAFEVVDREEQAFVAPSSWARYDGLAAMIAKLDARRAGAALKAMNPLLSVAWREVGRPGTTFRSALSGVLDQLLAVPVPEEVLELVPKGAVWAYAEPSLEALSPVQKHLLRMGPDNVRTVQAKLRELREAL